MGHTVITDSINPNNQVRDEWGKLANSVGAKFLHIEIVCSNKEEHESRLQTRVTTLDGLIDPTWQEIQQMEYQSWNLERLLVDTAGKTLEDSLEQIILALQSRL